MTQETAGLGHNNPPSDAEVLSAKLAEENEKVLNRAKALIESAGKIPEKFEDDETAEKAAEYIKMVNTCKKVMEDARTKAKEPFLVQGRMVDTFFKAHANALDVALDKAKKPLNAFVQEKAELERQRLREAEEQKRKEAEALASVAVAVSNIDVGAGEVAFEDALEAEVMANKMQVASQAKTGLGAVRTESGVTASTRKTVVGEVVDISKLDLETLRYLIPTDALQKALNAFIRNGGTELAGAKIWEKIEAVVR